MKQELEKVYTVTKCERTEKKIFFLADSSGEITWTQNINEAKKFDQQGTASAAASEIFPIDRGVILYVSQFFEWEEEQTIMRPFGGKF